MNGDGKTGHARGQSARGRGQTEAGRPGGPDATEGTPQEAGARREGGDVHDPASSAGQLLQWTILAVSIVVILIAVAFVVYDAAQQEPTHVVVNIIEIRPGDPHVVYLDITNTGDGAAEHVTVEGTLTTPEGEETASLSFQFLPGGQTERHAMAFQLDPREGELVFTIAFTPRS